jgi:hypothetical protein
MNEVAPCPRFEISIVESNQGIASKKLEELKEMWGADGRASWTWFKSLI